ncbi:MAG TPA: hypothetical protein VHW24_13720 [Bryobacteraceae bacterium]|jgi:hypothetical protein|nr:hypothetical protein [Bryobacteraceae bacterium]
MSRAAPPSGGKRGADAADIEAIVIFGSGLHLRESDGAALTSYLRSMGGEIETGRRAEQLPDAPLFMYGRGSHRNGKRVAETDALAEHVERAAAGEFGWNGFHMPPGIGIR